MSSNVYDSTGDLPTNFEAFEDLNDSSSTQTLEQQLTTESSVAAICSAVGAVIWQSWKTKEGANKEKNMFAALSAIIEESIKNTDDTPAITVKNAVSSTSASLSKIDDDYKSNMQFYAEYASSRIDDIAMSIESILDSLSANNESNVVKSASELNSTQPIGSTSSVNQSNVDSTTITNVVNTVNNNVNNNVNNLTNFENQSSNSTIAFDGLTVIEETSKSILTQLEYQAATIVDMQKSISTLVESSIANQQKTTLNTSNVDVTIDSSLLTAINTNLDNLVYLNTESAIYVESMSTLFKSYTDNSSFYLEYIATVADSLYSEWLKYTDAADRNAQQQTAEQRQFAGQLSNMLSANRDAFYDLTLDLLISIEDSLKTMRDSIGKAIDNKPSMSDYNASAKSLIEMFMALGNMDNRQRQNIEDGIELFDSVVAKLGKTAPKFNAILSNIDADSAIKYKAITESIGALFVILGNTDDTKRQNVYESLDAFDNAIVKLEKIAPRLNTVMSSLVDSFIANAEKLKNNASTLEHLHKLVDSIETLATSIDRAASGLIKIAASIALAGLAILSFAKVVTVESIAMFTLGGLALTGFIWLLTKIDEATAMQGAKTLLVISVAIGILSMALSVFNNVTPLAIVNVAIVGTALVGMIWLLSKAKPANVGKDLLALAGGVSLIIIALAIGGNVLVENWSSIVLVVTVIIALGVAIGFANLIASHGKSGSGNGASMGILSMAAGIALLGLAIWAWHEVVPSWEYAMAPVAYMVALTVAFALVCKWSKTNMKDAGIGILAMSAAVGILALSMIPWKWVEEDSMIKALVGISVLAGIMTLMSKFSGNVGRMQQAGVGLLIASAAVAVLAFALLPWQYVEWESIFKAGLGITVITAAVLLLGKNAKDAILGSTSLVIAAAAVGVLAASLYLANSVDAGTYVGMGLFMTGITIGVNVLGGLGVQSILGATSLVIAAGATLIFAIALNKMSDVSTGSIIQLSAFIVAIGLAISGLGVVAPFALAGAAALIIASTSTIIFAKSLQLAKGANMNEVAALVAAMTSIAGVATMLGNPFTVVFTLAGSAALITLGAATLLFATSLKQVADIKLKPNELQDIGVSLSSFIGTILSTLDNNKDKLDNAEKGIAALADLGTLIYNLSEGLRGIATLVFPKYGVKDGKLVVVGTIDMNDALPMVGDGLGKLINSLTEPLTEIGKTDNKWYSKSDVEKGINAIQGMGDLVYKFSEGLKNMASLVFPKYEARNGKLVVVGTIDMKEALPKIGDSIGSIITALTVPLTEIGKGDNKWFSKSAVEKGIKAMSGIGDIFEPMTSLVKTFAENKIDAAYIKGTMAPAVNETLTVVNNMIQGVNGFDTAQLETKTTQLSGLLNVFKKADLKTQVKLLDETSTSVNAINKAIQSLNIEKLTKLDIQFKAIQSKSIVEGIEKLAKSIDSTLTPALKRLFAQLEEAIEKQNEILSIKQSGQGMPSMSGMQFAGLGGLDIGSGMQKEPSIKTKGNVKGADKYEDWKDNDSNPVMSILVEIYDLLESTGIRVHG